MEEAEVVCVMAKKSKLKPITGQSNITIEPPTLVARMRVHGPLPKEHALNAMIGHVASEWSHVEHILDLIIWELAKVPYPYGACITAQVMGSYGRCKAIIALLKQRGLSERAAKDTQALMYRCQTTAEGRNRIIHDPWYIETGGSKQPAQFKGMAYREWAWGIKDVDVEKIDKTVVDIQKRKEEAAKLLNAISVELESLRKK